MFVEALRPWLQPLVAAVIAYCVVTGCNLLFPSSEREMNRYPIDGVDVVLEEGAGPAVEEMLLAVELFRRDVAVYLMLDAEEEETIWGELRQIHWTGDIVDNGGWYEGNQGIIRLEYLGCAIHGELYPLLLRHYRWHSDGSRELTEDDEVWYTRLEATYEPAVCG